MGPPRLPVVATVLVTAAVLGPMFTHGGIALRGDMVFTPDQPWKPAWLGLNGAVPRAVPMDALISLVDEVVPGAVLQRVLLVAAFVLGGLGMTRLTGRFTSVAQTAAVVVYLWNPWVLERLEIGQWPMLLAYGLLPWVVRAALRLRDGRPGGWPDTMLVLLGCGICAPSFGLMSGLVVVAVVLPSRSVRRLLGVLAMALVANLPWLVPALLGPGLDGSAAQFDSFAARGESGLGTFASLLSLGGIWKSSIVPGERTEPIVILVAGLLSIVYVYGFRYARSVIGDRTAAALAGIGGTAFLVALLPTIGPPGELLGALSEDWSWVGILRDSHRYLAPFALVLAVGAAAVVERLAGTGRDGRAGRGGIAIMLIAAPVLLLPSLSWGLVGGLRPVPYPDDWDQVAATVVSSDGAPGAVVSLPWAGNYRGYDWNKNRAVLDPADRYLPGDVLADDRLFLREGVLPSEDPFLARIGAVLAGPDPAVGLRALGVRWVLVAEGNGVQASDLPRGRTAYDGPSLSLIDLGAPEVAVDQIRQAPNRAAVLAADFVALAALCVSFSQLWLRIMRNRHIEE